MQCNTVKVAQSWSDSDGNSATVVGYTTLSAEHLLRRNFHAFADLTEATGCWLVRTLCLEDLIALIIQQIADKSNKR